MLRLFINMTAFAVMVFIIAMVGMTAHGFANVLSDMGGLYLLGGVTALLLLGLYLASR